jgi:hypothetical protein
MGNKTKAVLLIVALDAIFASALFLSQGGFGGGHGGFDGAIAIMGLPWVAVPWPDLLVKHDLVWLVGVPFVLNIVSVLLLASIIRATRRGTAKGQ